ncbi:baseplate wedge tail fiber connector [Yersinia phage MHG19]|nr:baseplate wedge tail fiber connector [Yersinia phage MHG19]
MAQKLKQRIDTGEIGNASTGDILYDGGNKINDNFDAIYDAFGDQRLHDDTTHGVDRQKIHATGYYQKLEDQTEAYVAPVELGSMHDINTSSGAVYVNLPKGKRGELVVFVNSNGSISVNNPLRITPNNSFVGISGDLIITSPFVRVECWCISDEGGRSVWDHSITSMFGQRHIPLEKTFNLNTTPADIRIAHITEFNSIKLMVSAASPDGKRLKTAEIMLLIDTLGKKVNQTEYAVLKSGPDDEDSELYKLNFKIGTGDYVIVAAESLKGTLRFSIKTIATQKIGTAQ